MTAFDESALLHKKVLSRYHAISRKLSREAREKHISQKASANKTQRKKRRDLFNKYIKQFEFLDSIIPDLASIRCSTKRSTRWNKLASTYANVTRSIGTKLGDYAEKSKCNLPLFKPKLKPRSFFNPVLYKKYTDAVQVLKNKAADILKEGEIIKQVFKAPTTQPSPSDLYGLLARKKVYDFYFSKLPQYLNFAMSIQPIEQKITQCYKYGVSAVERHRPALTKIIQQINDEVNTYKDTTCKWV